MLSQAVLIDLYFFLTLIDIKYGRITKEVLIDVKYL